MPRHKHTTPGYGPPAKPYMMVQQGKKEKSSNAYDKKLKWQQQQQKINALDHIQIIYFSLEP